MAEVVSLGGLGFLRTELETGLMLARIARSAKRADKRDRNLLNARKAYEAVLRFMPGVMLTTRQTEELKKKLERLKKELRTLGEDVQ